MSLSSPSARDLRPAPLVRFPLPGPSPFDGVFLRARAAIALPSLERTPAQGGRRGRARAGHEAAGRYFDGRESRSGQVPGWSTGDRKVARPDWHRTLQPRKPLRNIVRIQNPKKARISRKQPSPMQPGTFHPEPLPAMGTSRPQCEQTRACRFICSRQCGHCIYPSLPPFFRWLGVSLPQVQPSPYATRSQSTRASSRPSVLTIIFRQIVTAVPRAAA